ncbi:MAG: DUF1638 domain-containing protein [Magnetococcales bacterium]|nr:DUF1638 domain-containing protein [Magnetococcales bacterium]
MKADLTILVCGHLHREVEAAVAAEGLRVEVKTFSADCDQPLSHADELLKTANACPGEVMALEGGCLTPHRERLTKAGITLFGEALCFELLASQELLATPLDQGAHLLTPGLLQNWREKAARWNFTPEQAKSYFQESGSHLLLLDTGIDPETETHLNAFADYTGLPAQCLPVGLAYLGARLSALVYQERLTLQKQELLSRNRQLADAAMLVQLTGQLTVFLTEEAVIQGTLELFNMLCAPEKISFAPMGSPETAPLFNYPEPLSPESMTAESQTLTAITESGPLGEDGFDLVLTNQNQTMGVLRVAGIAFPQHRDRYLNQAIQVAPVAGLAIANARTMQARERDAKRIATLNHTLAQRLAELHAVNDELEAFTYSVSHDLRSPLRAIDGFSAALMREYGEQLEGKSNHYLTRVRAGATRMGQLIDDLLKLSRSTRGEMNRSSCDLSLMAEEVIAALRAKEPQRQVEVQIETGLQADADARFVRVALENLLGNAWKYTGRTPNPRITMSRDGDHFVIGDNGAGFDMAYAKRLFQPFQRLHDETEFEGSGIGLSTVKRVIQRHGGDIRVESAVGEGTRFYFSLEPEESSS